MHADVSHLLQVTHEITRKSSRFFLKINIPHRQEQRGTIQVKRLSK